jgi:DNA-3-methyladenine glycosylase I
MTRCEWLTDDPMLIAYHDSEWGVPEFDAQALWESLMLSGFQAGLSWLTILHKRDAFRKAFKGFRPEVVARFEAKDVDRLMSDVSIIRSKSKIEATIAGAKALLQMKGAGQQFPEFVWEFADHQPVPTKGSMPTESPASALLAKALKERGFKFVGPVIVYAWMQSVGIVNDHTLHCFRRKEIQKATPHGRDQPRNSPTLSQALANAMGA